VADRAGISESFLSQIERGHSSASVATLRRVAVALGVRIGDLFDQGSPSGTHVLRSADRPKLSFGILGSKMHLNSTADRSFDMFICEFQPGGSSGPEPYVHGDAEEIALVLAGPVIFEVGEEVVHLSGDDSIRYRTTTPHRVAATPEAGARVLFVTNPPTF
jgi:transcriptional regulator with XRE-family HTH domain